MKETPMATRQTLGDPNWVPLATTPNLPEYPAAQGCVTGAVTSVLAVYSKTPNLTLRVTATYAIQAALEGVRRVQLEPPAAGKICWAAAGANLRRNAFPPLDYPRKVGNNYFQPSEWNSQCQGEA